MLEDQNLKTSELRDVETSEKIAQLERLLLAEQLNAEDRKTVERNISRLKATLRREEEQGVFALESAKLDTIKRSLAAELKALANSFLLQGIARASFFDPIGVLQIGASVIINEGIDAALSGIKLADGGIVRATPGGVRATIGEGGQDEAVIPLDSPRGRAMLGNNQAREIIIMTDDGTELTRAISGKQNEMLQTGQITR